ncbi:hypothetical protein [Nocardiopsis kunsanensis]|uniref:DUF2567 domain-containing protein n=1 Tax=Nocardiopsis kunsanensis TaxID=141693 RepID=A0A918X6J9_9ACTN|nr:hypothetical protein [Nocardiopsis kunsanensis]GHD15378.1 hypothetical protein GCM10007147_02590 [Nocardiopsis kunsanensis]
MTDQSQDGRAPVRRTLVIALVTFASIAAAGALLGLLWWVLAPRPEGTSLGGGEVFTGATEDVFAGEGYFLIMTAIAGLVTGYVAYMVQFPLARRRQQDLRLTGLLSGVLGAAAGTLLTFWVGTGLDAPLHRAVAEASQGEAVTAGLQLDATAFLVAWPFVYVLQYGLLDAISMVRRDLPGRPEAPPMEGVSPLPAGDASPEGGPTP